MSEELKDFQTAPTLTLNPFAEEEKAQPEVKKEEPLMDENVLSEEERKMADQFANQIDLTKKKYFSESSKSRQIRFRH